MSLLFYIVKLNRKYFVIEPMEQATFQQLSDEKVNFQCALLRWVPFLVHDVHI